MTYWLILFQVLKTEPNSGPIKKRITRRMYETICEMDLPIVEIENFNYRIDVKRVFAIERNNEAFIVADAFKLPKE